MTAGVSSDGHPGIDYRSVLSPFSTEQQSLAPLGCRSLFILTCRDQERNPRATVKTDIYLGMILGQKDEVVLYIFLLNNVGCIENWMSIAMGTVRWD